MLQSFIMWALTLTLWLVTMLAAIPWAYALAYMHY